MNRANLGTGAHQSRANLHHAAGISRRDDVRIRAAVPFSLLPTAAVSNAPTPGAILLGSSDISTANGLDPDSLERAMNQTRPIVETPRPSVGDLPVPLPVLDRA